MFIIAQILGLVAMLTNMLAVQFKTKKQILLVTVVANLLFVISYILLEAYIGAVTCAVVAVEIIINTILESKGKATSTLLIVIYLAIAVTMGTVTFNGLVDLLPIIAEILFILTLIQKQENNVRILILGEFIAWLIYDFFVQAYLAGTSDVFAIISTIIAIVRYKNPITVSTAKSQLERIES